MDLLAFLVAAQNLPFAISGVFLLLLLLLEIIGVLFAGIGLSHFGEMIHGDHDADAGSLAGDALGYLHWGKVPLIVILSALTGVFALTGFGVQSIASWLGGALLPAWMASIPAVAGAVYGTHKIVIPLSKLMPSEEGGAMRESDFIGLIGTVTLGPCRSDSPGEALVKDLNGREHYIRVKPERAGEVLPMRGEIVIVARLDDSNVYTATSIAENGEPVSIPVSTSARVEPTRVSVPPARSIE